ncbi:hypothetical protein EKO04_005453 [Ascochyta lentis]|uniref:SRR1-like domain-containing protein n=1 Tax=Ascochyta lentis TaxID=205686 RepID=A0A8H7J4X7_9PLEO|nr:hypothetical protein EKO04_005453 [Ascochyta lentis]
MGGRGRVKRQQVEADDGWTVITHGLSSLSVGSKSGRGKGKRNGTRHNALQAGSMPTATVDGLTAEKLLHDFNNRTEKWEATVCAQHLQNILAKTEWDIRDAVCIGIGSFSRDWEHRHRAMWQLVLFVSVVSHMRKKNLEVKLYAQEPAFTPLDHEFLSLLGIGVCTDDIQTHITIHSFVFSPFVDWYILLPIFLNGKEPVLYVGNEILDDYGAFAQSEEKREKLEECNELGEKWLAKRDMVRLRDFEMHPHALNGMVVYRVKNGEENEVDSKEVAQEKANKREAKNEGKDHVEEAENRSDQETDTREEKKEITETDS